MPNVETCLTGHPIWEDTIDGLLDFVGTGRITADETSTAVTWVAADLRRSGRLPDFSRLQSYLRAREAPVQLEARPFGPGPAFHPDIRCLDPETWEPRGHYLHVATGFAGNAANAEIDEARLKYDTGILVIQ